MYSLKNICRIDLIVNRAKISLEYWEVMKTKKILGKMCDFNEGSIRIL